MKAIFKFTPMMGSSTALQITDLIVKPDFKKYINGNLETEILVEFSVAADTPEKEQMYAYYHRVVLAVAMRMYTDDGWESVDKVKADYFLKAECGKELIYNSKTDTESIYLLDKKSMNKDRLRKYIIDCVNFLEKERGYQVPESAQYLAEMKTGIKGLKSLR